MALIEAAESLFGQRGIDNVTTREIGVAIGSANTSVVAYHFGSKEALVEAIYRHRIAAIEQRRQELIEQAGGLAGLSPEQGLAIMFQPLLEQVNDSGEHSYARFLLSVIRARGGRIRRAMSAEFPVTNSLASHLQGQVPDAPEQMRELRWRLVTILLLELIAGFDEPGEGSVTNGTKGILFTQTIKAAAQVFALGVKSPAAK